MVGFEASRAAISDNTLDMSPSFYSKTLPTSGGVVDRRKQQTCFCLHNQVSKSDSANGQPLNNFWYYII